MLVGCLAEADLSAATYHVAPADGDVERGEDGPV
jgi:hypothetical protein